MLLKIPLFFDVGFPLVWMSQMAQTINNKELLCTRCETELTILPKNSLKLFVVLSHFENVIQLLLEMIVLLTTV